MNQIAKLASLVALAGILVPCLLLLAGSISLSFVQNAALISTITWFVSTPVWMRKSE